jgi:mono/diheme cytochrome c family protein
MRAGTLLFAALSACVALTAAYAAIELPEGPNRALVYGQCRTCHDLQYLEESAGITRDDWDQMLISMRQYGLRLKPDQRAKILDYLATYLGPNPPPKGAAAAKSAKPAKISGAEIFANQCSACHQPKGQGVAGSFPPLARNADLFLSEDYPVRVVLFGLSGKITVNGKQVNSVMPPLNVLGDRQIAAVVNYVRGAFGNDALRPKAMQAVTPAMVSALRKKKLGPEQVFAHRKRLKARGKGAARD